MGAAEVQITAARHNTRPQACSSLWFRSVDSTHFDSGTESDDLSECKNKPLEFIRFQLTIDARRRRAATAAPEGGSRDAEPRSGESERIAPRDALSSQPLHECV